MAAVKWIANEASIPKEKQFVLIKYGNENGLHRRPGGLTYSIDRSLSPNLLEAHLQTIISEAQTMADFEHIDTVYVTLPKSTIEKTIERS
jgi:hypothetical protein